MRAFALDEFGAAGSVHDLPIPEPADGEVRIKVAAGGINPFDTVVLKGALKDRMQHDFPLIPCSDFAGTVDALGSVHHERRERRVRQSTRSLAPHYRSREYQHGCALSQWASRTATSW